MARGWWRRGPGLVACALLALTTAVGTQDGGGAYGTKAASEPGLLFYLSADRGLTADVAAGGDPAPNFAADVKVIPKGAKGPGLECAHTQLLSYWAPGNIYAQRGTVAFSWRAREPVGPTAFPIFRVGYADHSSWDMVWLRIDYNGQPGFDAFVTDASLARTRVSVPMPAFPAPDQWVHLALSWDETRGIRFYVDGRLAAKVDGTAVFDAALDQFGPHSRVISPYQVQSAYNFVRGGDIDELRIYDRMLDDGNVAALARGEAVGTLPPVNRALSDAGWREEWWHRHGWDRPGDVPPAVDGPSVRIRKVEIHDAYDLKRWWWKGTDGIRETTWPGVYNRSRLPGRHDYFELPDWDCYSLSGKTVTFVLPDEPWNQVEVSGAAFGSFAIAARRDATDSTPLFERPKGAERTFHRVAAPITGQALRFTNVEQETPIGELGAYYVTAGREPAGATTLSYRITALAAPNQAGIASIKKYVDGRYAPDERHLVVALPSGAPRTPRAAPAGGLPIVHVAIPADFRDGYTGALGRASFSYTWANLQAGLDGIAIDLPALKVVPTHGESFPLQIQVHDPLWPLRTMMDVSVSVKPGQPQTLWLDTRDRVLPPGQPLFLTIAGAGADFGPASLDGAAVRLVFKPLAEAAPEHVLDRFTQARDNFAHIIEERPNSRRLSLYTRFEADLTDLLRVDPTHARGREYWYEYNREQPRPAVDLAPVPPGVPAWAFRQGQYLRTVKRFVSYFIDHRQIENGEFGGGLSDDGDLTNWWPGTALMGVTPEKIRTSLLKEMDAFYAQGMFTRGLSTIQADELHSYEEGIQVLGQALLLDFGGPVHLERAMETAAALERLTGVNAAGHRHIRSAYFSGTKIAEESVWGWSKPSSYLVLHPAIALVDFNGSPRVKRLLLELADGLLAHRRPDGRGGFSLRTTIRFSTDEDVDGGNGERAMPLLWAAYRWTGDRKYLQPFLDAGPRALAAINTAGLDELGTRDAWTPLLLDAAKASTDPGTRHVAWQLTGNRQYLADLYVDQIESAAVREYINTQGSLWTDRSQINHGELQRSRLGGIALVRNAYVPGHAVSWSFAGTRDEERVAVLVQEATRTHLRVAAYNLGETPVLATMTAWDVEPGTWSIAQATGPDADVTVATGAPSRTQVLDRSGDIALVLAPGLATVVELRLVAPGTPYWSRPDLGVATRDVTVDGRTLVATVHSVGAVDAPAARLVVRDRFGVTLASARVPALAAPLDLRARTATVRVALPAGKEWQGGSVTIESPGAVPEITLKNNRAALPASVGAVVPAVQAPGARRPVTDPPLRDPQRPALFIVGDSTVKNHGPGDGWGDFVAPLVDAKRLQVLNWAMGGRSTRSALDEGRWARVVEQLAPGDVVLVQFGHNDQSEITTDRGTLASAGDDYEVVYSDRDGAPVKVRSFGSYLRQYVRDARAKGATIVLCTPVPRNWWLPDGRFNDVMAEHAALVKRVADEQRVPMLDLHGLLSARYVALGKKAVSTSYFTVGDNTHTNRAGAALNAATVVEALRAVPGVPIAQMLKP